jgi:hypothetical protein
MLVVLQAMGQHVLVLFISWPGSVQLCGPPCSAPTHHTQPAQTRVILAIGAQVGLIGCQVGAEQGLVEPHVCRRCRVCLDLAKY